MTKLTKNNFSKTRRRININNFTEVQLLNIRYFQIRRDLGYWVPIIVIAMAFLSWHIARLHVDYPYYIAGVTVFLVYTYHTRRRDTVFTDTYFLNSRVQMLINYQLSILPVSIGLGIHQYWLPILLMHCVLFFVPFTNTFKVNFAFKKVTGFIPASQFEWIAIIRKQFGVLLILLLIALVLSPVKLFSLVALLLLNTSLLNAHTLHEPLYMLNPERLHIQEFLNKKIWFTCKLVLVVNVPILIVNSLFQKDMMGFNAFFLVAFLIMAITMVYLKYADYTPNEIMGFKAEYIILTLGIFLPYALPLGVIILFNQRKKAIQNLNYYLHASA